MLWHVSTWNMTLWWDFKACGRLLWGSWNVEAGHNDMWDLIWGMWLRLDWVGVGWSPPRPPKINDHILFNGIFMHALECQMHQWSDVDVFCGKRNGWYISVHSWCMFAVIVIDDAVCKSVIYGTTTKESAVVYFFAYLGDIEWHPAVENEAFLCSRTTNCKRDIYTALHEETPHCKPQGCTQWLFILYELVSFYAEEHLVRDPNAGWEVHLVFHFFVLPFDSFFKLIDLNYGAFLHGFNISTMLFSPHV